MVSHRRQATGRTHRGTSKRIFSMQDVPAMLQRPTKLSAVSTTREKLVSGVGIEPTAS